MAKKTPQEKVIEQEAAMPDFDELLFKAEDIEPRLRSLWLEIYTNSCYDREKISIQVSEVARAIKGDLTLQAVHGPLLTKYLERMSKANDQLLKLSEQVLAYRTKQGELDSDSLLDQIEDE